VARGYGADHKRRRRAAKKTVEAGQGICWRCGEPLTAGEQFDLGHDDDDRSITRGPEHQNCNRAAAARKANSVRST
jgi:hypothetical protein